MKNTVEGIFSDVTPFFILVYIEIHSQNILLLLAMLMNKEPACF